MTRGLFRLFLEGFRSDADAYACANVEVASTISFAEGTGDGQVNRVYETNLEVTTGAGVELDLQTLVTTPDGPLAANKIKAITLEGDAANGVVVNVEPGAVNPWLGLFSGTGVSLFLRAGEIMAFGSRAGWDSSGASKTLAFSHGDASSQFVKVSILASTV